MFCWVLCCCCCCSFVATEDDDWNVVVHYDACVFVFVFVNGYLFTRVVRQPSHGLAPARPFNCHNKWAIRFNMHTHKKKHVLLNILCISWALSIILLIVLVQSPPLPRDSSCLVDFDENWYAWELPSVSCEWWNEFVFLLIKPEIWNIDVSITHLHICMNCGWLKRDILAWT